MMDSSNKSEKTAHFLWSRATRLAIKKQESIYNGASRKAGVLVVQDEDPVGLQRAELKAFFLRATTGRNQATQN
jgi:hypothetical protein